MKMQMTHIGVGIAALAALAAEGKAFSREELNAMLDKLAASPEPKEKRGPTAMCYSMAMPETKAFDYSCRKCGMRTHYPENYKGIGEKLAFCRDGAAKLRGVGLGITLDETALCQHCTSLKALRLPTSGVVIAEPKAKTKDDNWMCERFGLRIGDAVSILEWFGDWCRVVPKNPEYWIAEKFVDSDGRVLGDDVWVRYVPVVKGWGALKVRKGTELRRLTSQAGDPQGWVRVDHPKDNSGDYYCVDTGAIGSLGYEEGPNASLHRLKHLAWIINGKRTVVCEGDVELLEKFMKGDVYLSDGSDGTSVSMKSQLPRLRELLGESKK